jgi:hypothetical protein
MSKRGLKVGDRVRMTKADSIHGYDAGDQAKVFSGPHASVSNTKRYYFVTLDKDGPDAAAIAVLADEIAPAAGARPRS